MTLPIDDRQRDSTRGRLLALLRRQPMTTEELAAAVALTDNAVRAHLAALERDGLVTRAGLRRGPRKPSQAYALAEGVEPLLSRLYAPLAIHLVRELSARLTAEELGELLGAVGRRLAGTLATPGGTMPARVRAASDLLNGLSADTAVDDAGPALAIRGTACPLAAIAADQPAVCTALAALLAEVLDTPVSERCDRAVAQGPRCRFEIGNGAR